jgi:hypothetical protein
MKMNDVEQAIYEQRHINEMIKSAELTRPMFVYELWNYDEERVVSFVPIQAGDFVSVRLPDDSFLQERKVKRVLHQEHVGNIGKQILDSFIELE